MPALMPLLRRLRYAHMRIIKDDILAIARHADDAMRYYDTLRRRAMFRQTYEMPLRRCYAAAADIMPPRR